MVVGLLGQAVKRIRAYAGIQNPESEMSILPKRVSFTCFRSFQSATCNESRRHTGYVTFMSLLGLTVLWDEIILNGLFFKDGIVSHLTRLSHKLCYLSSNCL